MGASVSLGTWNSPTKTSTLRPAVRNMAGCGYIYIVSVFAILILGLWAHLDSLGVFGSAQLVVVNSVPLLLGPGKLSLCLALISWVEKAIGLRVCVHRGSDARSGMPACVNAGAKPAIWMELALVIQPVAEATHAQGIVGHGGQMDADVAGT